MDIQQSKGTVKLSLAQKKEMTVRYSHVGLGSTDEQRDLSLGLFEIANCFLEGSGTKKSPEVALNYLKLAANMGDLASQERMSSFLPPVSETDGQNLAFCCQKAVVASRRICKSPFALILGT